MGSNGDVFTELRDACSRIQKTDVRDLLRSIDVTCSGTKQQMIDKLVDAAKELSQELLSQLMDQAGQITPRYAGVPPAVAAVAADTSGARTRSGSSSSSSSSSSSTDVQDSKQVEPTLGDVFALMKGIQSRLDKVERGAVKTGIVHEFGGLPAGPVPRDPVRRGATLTAFRHALTAGLPRAPHVGPPAQLPGDEDEGDEDDDLPALHASQVDGLVANALREVQVYGSFGAYVRVSAWSSRRNKMECLSLAMAIDSLRRQGVTDVYEGVRYLVRRLVGVKLADHFNNWDLCDSVAPAGDSSLLLSNDMLARIARDGQRRAQMRKQAARNNSSPAQSGAGRRP